MATTTRKATIREGDQVRVTATGPRGVAGIDGTVVKLHRADRDYERRATVDFLLFDGPLRLTLALRFLEKAT